MKVLLIFPDTPELVIALLRTEMEVIGPISEQEDWQRELPNATAVITAVQPQFTAAVMDNAPRLRVIGRPGIGIDNSYRTSFLARMSVRSPARECSAC